jgi:tetratricopeptide (TPR) repeat protein
VSDSSPGVPSSVPPPQLSATPVRSGGSRALTGVLSVLVLLALGVLAAVLAWRSRDRWTREEAGRARRRAAEALLVGDFDGAIAQYDKALAMRPDDPELLEQRGALKLMKGDSAGAQSDANAALRGGPRKEALRTRAEARAHAADFDGAAADYEEAIRLGPEDPSLYDGFARVLEATNRRAAAEEQWAKALARSPVRLETLCARAESRFRAREFAGAESDAEAAVKGHPGKPDGWYWRALVRKAIGKEGALEDAKKAVELAPENWPRGGEARELVRYLEGAGR